MDRTPREHPRSGFESVEHTADVGLRAWGPTIEDLFTQAGTGLVALILNPETVRASDRLEFDLAAMDLEEGLVGFLQEILYFYEIGRFAPAAVRVSSVTPTRVTAAVAGEPFDRFRHETRTDVKAATYHDLRIRTGLDALGVKRFETVVIFDI